VPGSLVLVNRAAGHPLDNNLRQDLVRCIVDEFYGRRQYMGVKQYRIMTKKIMELFPGEEEETYIRLSHNNPKKSELGGKLVVRHKNFVKKMRRLKNGLTYDLL
jgi:hypothetical protein